MVCDTHHTLEARTDCHLENWINSDLVLNSILSAGGNLAYDRTHICVVVVMTSTVVVDDATSGVMVEVVELVTKLPLLQVVTHYSSIPNRLFSFLRLRVYIQEGL